MGARTFLKSESGNRGFFLSLDAVFGVIVIISVLLFAGAAARIPDSFPIERVQLAELGAATVAVLDAEGTFDALDGFEIDERLDALLPITASMQIQVNCESGATAETSREPPEKKFIASGIRFFVIVDGDSVEDNCVASWKTWNS